KRLGDRRCAIGLVVAFFHRSFEAGVARPSGSSSRVDGLRAGGTTESDTPVAPAGTVTPPPCADGMNRTDGAAAISRPRQGAQGRGSEARRRDGWRASVLRDV